MNKKERDLIKEAGLIFEVNRNAFFTDSDFWNEITSKIVSNDKKLSRDKILFFIRKYIDKLNWDYLSGNFKFTESELEEFIDYICWEIKGSRFQILSERFIRNHWNILDHPDICAYQVLSEDFIFDYFDELDSNIFSCQILSEDFIDRLNNDSNKRDRIDWFDVSRFVIFSAAGLKKYKDYLFSEFVFMCQPFINEEIIDLYINKYPSSDLSRKKDLLLLLYRNIFYNQRKRFGNKDWFVGYFCYHDRYSSVSSCAGYVPINVIERGHIDGLLIKGRAYYDDFLRTDLVKEIEILTSKENLDKKINLYKRI